jgi:hypothetical protein
MPINEFAQQHLDAFANNQPFPGGLNFRKALTQSALDYSLESLSRVDYLLDQIRTRIKPIESKFWDSQENQNFANLLCFYVGTTVARLSNQKITWYQYDEMIELIPDNANLFPPCFATHISCVLERKGFFIPLSAIQERLFDEPPQKSVRFSAEGFL